MFKYYYGLQNYNKKKWLTRTYMSNFIYYTTCSIYTGQKYRTLVCIDYYERKLRTRPVDIKKIYV